MKRLGLIINPIAGMGGSIGLKGTDGVLDQAISKGAVPLAGTKTRKAIHALLPIRDNCELLICSGEMGENVIAGLGFVSKIVYSPVTEQTSAEDTVRAAKAMVESGANIIAFAGGDGSARDIYRAIGETITVLGIPAGVKIHSPVYAQSPAKAGQLLKQYLSGQTTFTKVVEVVDINEDDYRQNIINTSLFGYLRVPYERNLMQGRKSPSQLSEKEAQLALAGEILKKMRLDTYYLIGSGWLCPYNGVN